MAKFLCQASYSPEGVQGLIKEGASGRQAAIKAGVKSVGGKVESLHFAFGTDDVVMVLDLPDNIAAARLSATVAASGLASVVTTPLLTVAEMDEALAKGAKYRGPGEA